MPLAKSITPKRIKTLRCLFAGTNRLFPALLILFFTLSFSAFSQDNSPYTRYGLGDIVPSTNMNMRGMGSISAGYTDIFSINYSNPASFGSFQAIREQNSKKLRSGRAILDVGLNFENRTLKDPNFTGKFTASNALFSHVQIGVPLKANWGLSFGLRPITRISYSILTRERLYDPNTNMPIDSALTLNEGNGGLYLASAGLGHKFVFNEKNSFSLGINGGYLFGKKDYSARRTLINDTVEYKAGNFETTTTFGDVYVSGGLQYQARLDSATVLTLGAYGNLKQTLKATQDIVRETYYYDASTGNTRIDSVYENNGNKGELQYPSSFTAGFTIQRYPTMKKGGWLFGADFTQTKWADYKFYGQPDSVRNTWQIRAGAELRPSFSAGRKSYFGNVAYRAGLFFGPDYIHLKEKLPVMGVTFGLGLPILSQNRFSPGQATFINLAFEYIKRGNNNNLLKENLFRVSLGFSLSDFWFVKRRYE